MSTARPNPNRPQTLIELSSCVHCSRVVQRVIKVEGVLETRPWGHRETGLPDCDPADVAYRARCVRGKA